MKFNEIDLDGRRRIIDMVQAYDALTQAQADLDHRFPGSIRWASRGGSDYLYRKIKASEKSLGPRSSET
ncbi:hypothetical protein JCM17960_08420 [Magnetospira thiophila]